jgi:hypothetical protein
LIAAELDVEEQFGIEEKELKGQEPIAMSGGPTGPTKGHNGNNSKDRQDEQEA